MQKILIAMLVLSNFLLTARTSLASEEVSCVPGALPNYLDTIRQERRPTQVGPAVECALRLAPSRETAALLITRLERILELAQKLDARWPADNEAAIAVTLAN